MAELGKLSNCVLLTGAGLSRNWGGQLASDLWGRLLGSLAIQRSARIRGAFLDGDSYENVYTRVECDPEISNQEKTILRAALENEFAAMHRQMSAVGYFPLNEYGFNEFLLRFCGARDNQNIDTAYLFTLNQDLLIETKLIQTHMHPRAHPCIPGVRFQHHCEPFASCFAPLEEPAEVAFDPEHHPDLRRNLNYIKLHGSFGWRLPGGGPALVIGTNKTAQIREIPLLDWYSSVF